MHPRQGETGPRAFSQWRGAAAWSRRPNPWPPTSARRYCEDGGNAVDAAVAVAFALSATLPSAGNLGGGGFLLLRTPTGAVSALDFREVAPPSSGGVHLIEMLNVLEGFDLHAMGHNSAAALHVLVESMRQAYADRSLWLGDPAFFDVPVDWLTSRAYADEIRAAIPAERARSSSDVRPGHPPDRESPDTTHLCAVDASGLSVSLTYTLNVSYGCRAVAAGTGLLLNNEMDDFTASPKEPNAFGLVGGAAHPPSVAAGRGLLRGGSEP